MKGYDEFITIFGDISVLQVAEVILAGIFLRFCYIKLRDFLIKQHEAQVKRDEQLKEALDGVHMYPTYRQQSIEIQHQLQEEIMSLRKMQEEYMVRLQNMEDRSQRRDRNRIRDRLLESYRYYTSIDQNPSQSWTRMESDAFWDLFADYEDAGGNGYIHTVVQPAMDRLHIIEMNEKH